MTTTTYAVESSAHHYPCTHTWTHTSTKRCLAKDTMTQSVGQQTQCGREWEGEWQALLLKHHDWGNNSWHISYVCIMLKAPKKLPHTHKWQKKNLCLLPEIVGKLVARARTKILRERNEVKKSCNFPYESRTKSINKVKYAKKWLWFLSLSLSFCPIACSPFLSLPHTFRQLLLNGQRQLGNI